MARTHDDGNVGIDDDAPASALEPIEFQMMGGLGSSEEQTSSFIGPASSYRTGSGLPLDAGFLSS